MNSRLLEHIISDLRQYGKQILIVDDVNDFFSRDDVLKQLHKNNVFVNHESNLSQRISYYSSDHSSLHLFIQNQQLHLEDITQFTRYLTFSLSQYLGSYHLETILDLDLKELDKLYHYNPIKRLSAEDTKALLSDQNEPLKTSLFSFDDCCVKIVDHLNRDDINWHIVLSLFSDILIDNPEHFDHYKLQELLNDANIKFQEHLERNFKSFPSSNPIIKPKLVSKILDHIEFNYREEKVALVVVDGFSYWQYKMLSEIISDELTKIEDITYAWIPTITQLSRQALFRGDIPDKQYVQNPINEKKLWFSYWASNGFSQDEIDYQHDPKEFKVSNRTMRLGIVFKDLDDKMHSSSDYKDLKSLTQHWFDRSEIVSFLEKLITEGFKVILTTDHGNIEAEGWRKLTGREKLGTNKSGSRSQRHIEYTDNWLVREFVDGNEEIQDSVVIDEQAIYFKDNKSFSSEDHLVTHGGSHFFEVLIPFIKLSKD